MKHRVRETGGVISTKLSENGHRNLFYTEEKEVLKESPTNRLGEKAENSDIRKRLLFYHQLALQEELWVYHTLDVRKDKHLFEATLDETEKKFLGGTKDDLAHLEHAATMWSAQNELGLKGNWKDLFYLSYYRHKSIELRCQEKNDEKDLHEHYVGLTTRYKLTEDKDLIHLAGEYLFGGLYKARIGYESNLLDVACEHIKYKPSFLAQRYHGYCREWNNTFIPPTATQLSGGVRLAGAWGLFRPGLSFTRVDNHIYFQHISPSELDQIEFTN
jgi:hypothetical protein